MKQSEIVELATEELFDRLEEQKETLTKYKMNHVVSSLENPKVIANTRKTIARLMTEINKRKAE